MLERVAGIEPAYSAWKADVFLNDFNARLLDFVQTDGRIFVSSTTIDGVYWMRVAILCFRTHLREIDTLLEVFRKGVEEVRC